MSYDESNDSDTIIIKVSNLGVDLTLVFDSNGKIAIILPYLQT